MADIVVVCALFLLGIPASYVMNCLLLQEKDSHEGPFPIGSTIILFESGHTQRAALFDLIRRFFGAYSERKERTSVGQLRVWELTNRAEYFTCPFCLSFWIAFPFSIFAAWQFNLPFLWWIIVHFGIATVSRISHRGMYGE